MYIPLTDGGNRHVVVIQDLFTKWLFIFPVPDQKAPRIAHLLAEEVVPLFRVLLNLCKILGIDKLNTSSYHQQCDGAVEHFNRTLKQILR